VFDNLKLVFVFKIFPALIVYRDYAGKSVGKAQGPVISIKLNYRGDEGLHAHELAHVEQFYKLFLIHSLLYLVSSRYRYYCEIRAYRRQLDFTPTNQKQHKAKEFSKNIGRSRKFNATTLKAYGDLS